jgi:trimeric autotransporter adhesin
VAGDWFSRASVVRMIAVAVMTSSFAAFGQVDSLTLGSGTAQAVNLNLTSPSGSEPATLQWTLTYPANAVVAISASAGAAATNAAKTLSCSSAAGAYSCLVSGLNANTISNGVVAVVNVSLAAGVGSTSIAVSNPVAGSTTGEGISVSGTGGTLTAPTLVSIAVTPANPSVAKGATQQFTATGTYSDSSTQNLTASVTWSSNKPAVASITAAALATGVAAGSTTIQATSGAISGSTGLTVTAPTLVSVAVTPANPSVAKG